jgi:type IV pilus assembly protein PilQ
MITAIRAHLARKQRGLCHRVFTVLAQVTVLGLLASVTANAGNSLENIEVQSLPGDKVELRLILSGPAPEPLAFTIDQPARIALDLADTSLAMDSRRTDVGMGVLDTVLAAEANGRTRVVLNLDDLVAYDTRVAGNIVYVTLDTPAIGQPAVTEFVAATSAAAVSSSGNREIESIDFRRTEAGGGRIIVGLSDSSTPVDVRQEGGRVIVNFGGTQMPAELLKRLDVMDFATPVTTIDAMQSERDARLVISSKGSWEELAYQTDRTFTVEIQPIAEEEGPEAATLYSGTKEYTGERLTLNFQDIDARAVLQLLADISGRNIVVSDTVSGNVTLRLQNVPWDQAMDIVLATKGLDMRENGNVIIVAPAQEIAAREKADLESRREIKELEPL